MFQNCLVSNLSNYLKIEFFLIWSFPTFEKMCIIPENSLSVTHAWTCTAKNYRVFETWINVESWETDISTFQSQIGGVANGTTVNVNIVDLPIFNNF